MKMRGFTLFEILVAVSIFAVISSMTMSSLIQVGRTGEKVSESQQQLSEIQFALGYLSKDIVQMSNRKIRDQYGDEQPQLLITENRLAFTRNGWSNLLQQPRSNLQRVQYQLVDNNFQRVYWPELDQSYTEVSVTQTLLQKVEEFSVKLLTKGQESFESWPLDAQNTSAVSPIAIELTLKLTGLGQVQRIYEISDALLL
ncbi:MAG: type II secretion system minor pseudopilin GspJ [Gammaproteobacteria bacterium]|nr:type II secretion system minor pseudopilin GspJ [Gammaproteobacteria bacterium]